MELDIRQDLKGTAWAFRGYNVTNLGRTPELLEHPAYGAIVERNLKDAAELYSSATLKRVDLVKRVRLREETTLENYGEAISLIVATERAQLEILKELYGVEFNAARLAVGYSLGEVSALVATGVYSLEALLTPILKLSDDCVELARNTRMGIVFSRGPALDTQAIEKLCVEVTARNQGTICISSYLAPNSVLVLGQGRSLDLFREEVKTRFPREIHVKENPDRWPPIHTAIVRQRNVPDRASVMLETVPGGFQVPSIPIISAITGADSYNDFNSRQLLYDWVDHPQRLWSVIEKLLASDIHRIIHLGPEPNIIPATLKRLSMNITAQLSQRNLASLGMRAVSSIVHSRPWLTQYLSKNAALLRAPLLQQIVAEDWLLANVPE
ncbi:ACP S-malonyltransferase [bacterium]|nr:ACP S-malonyltransferase [bacterium]